MKVFHIFFILLIVLLHLSMLCCIDANQDPLNQFDVHQTKIIKPTIWIPLEEYEVLQPKEIIKYDDYYIIINQTRKDVIKCVNFSTNKVISGVNYGNGPNELNMIGKLRKVNEKLLINDISLKKIYELNIIQDSILQIESFSEINYDKKLFVFDYLDDNIVIASGFFIDFWIGYIDIHNNVLLSSIDFPKFEKTSHVSGEQKSVLYISSHISLSPNSKKLVVATQYAGVISFVNVGETLKEYKQIKYFSPDFSVIQGGNISHSKDEKVGFCGVDCDDEYIYALYSGRTFNSHRELSHHCENILVYDWDGNPIKRYILDVPIWSMGYDIEKNSIYGIAYNPEGGFIEYQL